MSLCGEGRKVIQICGFAVAVHEPLNCFALTSISLSDFPFLYDIIEGVV